MSRSLMSLLTSGQRPRVLLVGDMILDRYQHGVTQRISPEAPIPVLAAERDEHKLGGCGNVAANLAALGAGVVTHHGHRVDPAAQGGQVGGHVAAAAEAQLLALGG